MLSQQVVDKRLSFQYAGDYCPDQEYSSPIAKESKERAEEAGSLDNKEEAIAQTEDETAGSSAAEAHLPVEDVDTTAPFKFSDSVLAGFSLDNRSNAVSSAKKTLGFGATATEAILQMATRIQERKLELSRKEFGVFVKGLLQWRREEVRKYLDIARVFEGFDLARLVKLEPFTILKLRSKKYAPIIEQLRSHGDITPNLVQDLIKELITKPTRKKPSEPISSWKQSRSGGGRYYNLLLHD